VSHVGSASALFQNNIYVLGGYSKSFLGAGFFNEIRFSGVKPANDIFIFEIGTLSC